MLRLVEQSNKQHWGQSLSSHIRAEAGGGRAILFYLGKTVR